MPQLDAMGIPLSQQHSSACCDVKAFLRCHAWPAGADAMAVLTVTQASALLDQQLLRPPLVRRNTAMN